MTSPVNSSLVPQLALISSLCIVVGAFGVWAVCSTIQRGEFALGKGASRTIVAASTDPIVFWGVMTVFAMLFVLILYCPVHLYRAWFRD